MDHSSILKAGDDNEMPCTTDALWNPGGIVRIHVCYSPTLRWAMNQLGHAYLANRQPIDAEREYHRSIECRKGGEDFLEPIDELRTLLSLKPDTPRGQEMLSLLESEQMKLDAEMDSANPPKKS